MRVIGVDRVGAAGALLVFVCSLDGCDVLERPEYGRDCTDGPCQAGFECLTEQCVPIEPGTVAGEQRDEPKTGATWVWMPAGTFHYGCEPQDTQCEADEQPGRAEQVDGFWMMQTEVTSGAYDLCNASDFCANGEGVAFVYPVHSVDWHESKNFCAWVGGRLPTAVEWEYAAKSGRSRVYQWGDEAPNENLANCSGCGDPFEQTSSVGSFPAGDTPWGLKDMAGNVSEWTASSYDSSSKELRGGSWGRTPANLRASVRGGAEPARRFGDFGFRCAQ